MNCLYYKQIIVFWAMVCILTACSAPADPYLCNYRTDDITPRDSVVLAGFAARKGLSSGIHKKLSTHCLVLSKENRKICIITNDLMEISPSTADELRTSISRKSGVPFNHIFIHCIHTHSAPRTGGWCAQEGKPNFLYAKQVRKIMVENAVAAIQDSASYQPFNLQIGKGRSSINCNRRDENGYCSRDCYVLRLVNKKNEPLVSLVNYACHPVSLNHKSNVISTDFPGFTAEKLEKEWGGNVLYFSGASGNSDPSGGLSDQVSYAEQKGYQLAQEIRNISFAPVKTNGKFNVITKEVRLPFQADIITVPLIRKHVREITGWDVSDTWVKDVKYWEKYTIEAIKNGKVKNYLPVGISAVNIGGVILLFTQGEPFMEYQTRLRNHFPDIPILFIAYTNGQNSYLPDIEAYLSDKYEYETKQMHIYIGAPYPLSSKMPEVYSRAIENITKEAIQK